ncbi:unnamed protein product, partial [Rotaria sp. Silwood2]
YHNYTLDAAYDYLTERRRLA